MHEFHCLYADSYPTQTNVSSFPSLVDALRDARVSEGTERRSRPRLQSSDTSQQVSMATAPTGSAVQGLQVAALH
jgi:hypothetical protein